MKTKTVAKTVEPAKRTFPRPAGRSRFTIKQIDEGWRWVWAQEAKQAQAHVAATAN